MFFRFPPDARWNPDRDAVESASAWANMKASFAFPGACSRSCSPRPRVLYGASKLTISTEPGSNSSLSGRFVAAS